MQVISNTNGIDSQHQMLLNLFQNFIEIHSEDYENLQAPSLLRKQMNQNIKREWNYFKYQINTNPLNTDKITTYFHLLEKSLLENNSLDNSPSHSPFQRPSQNHKEMNNSSKSPNTRFLTINPNDVPKDAFKKNCFKRSTNAAQNNINLNANNNDEVVSSKRTQQAHGYFSPQIQPNSDRQFSQVLHQFEQNTMKNARSPYYISNNATNQTSFSSAVQLNSSDSIQPQKNNFVRPSQFQQQQQVYQNNYQTQINSSSNPPTESYSANSQPGLIKVDESNYNSPPIYPIDQANIQRRKSQQQQQVLSKLDNEENSVSNSENSSTRNSQDIINNVSTSQQNTNINALNTNSSPLLNNTQSSTSLQIENLKNQAQQFYKEYKSSQQVYSMKNNQLDASKNAVQNQNLAHAQRKSIGVSSGNSAFPQVQLSSQNQAQSPIIPLLTTIPISMQGQNQGQQHSHSVDQNQANNINKVSYNNFHQYRALSPTPQSTQTNNFYVENRTFSPNTRFIHNPQVQNQPQQQSSFQQPPQQKQAKNALNYKNKLLQAASQAVPLNQYQTSQQQKNDQSSNSSSLNNLSMTTNNLTQQQSLVQQYGIQENQQTVQRYQSPTRQISQIQQQQQINQNHQQYNQQQQQQQSRNSISEQQSIIDEMLRYQFKIKNVIEKTQLLETFMKNNSSAINSLFNL